MDHGSSDRIPASALILLASIVFTLTAFAVFTMLWEIPIPVYSLVLVLGLQVAALLLGSSKILTQLGAASLSALVAMIASLASVYFIFPPVLELKLAGGVGGVSALVFVLASFVAASRTDPVPSGIPEPMILGDLETSPSSELIKYGEIRAPEAADIHDLPLSTTVWPDDIPGDHRVQNEGPFSSLGNEGVYEFDELSESRMEQALGGEESVYVLDPGDDEESILESVTSTSRESFKEVSRPEVSREAVIPKDWVEETARSMAYDSAEAEPVNEGSAVPSGDKNAGSRPAAAERLPAFKMRTRYKVLDEVSGEHYGTYFGDEGYSTLDTVSLVGLLGSRLADGELRIVKLDWSNFDEVEVHVRIEEVLTARVAQNEGREVIAADDQPRKSTGDFEVPAENEPPEEIAREVGVPETSPSAPRYAIYDRRTIQPMGEYAPKGKRSRIDRLTLYKMFPEYDFKTFEIDSIRWEDDEVRIFIKGEKKKSPKAKGQSPKEGLGQRRQPDKS